MPIYYTGIGSYESGIHNEEDFHRIVTREYIDNWNVHFPNLRKIWVKVLNQNQQFDVNHPNNEAFIVRNLPQDFPFFSLDDWIEYVEAKRV